MGICEILKNKSCLDYLNENKEKKIILIANSYFLFKNYIIQKQKFINKLVEKDLKVNFVDSPKEEENEDIMINNENSIFNEKVEMIYKENDKILNCDEIKLFIETMKNIKKDDNETYNKVIFQYLKTNTNEIEERLYKYKNIKIIYEQKEYFTPRKIVKIKNSYLLSKEFFFLYFH